MSFLVWFEIIGTFKNAHAGNPTPFMSHISHNVILAFAIYLVINRLIIQKNMQKFQIFLHSFFAFAMTINMFITGGRAGQVAFLVMIGILIFQFFSLSKIKAFFVTLFVVPAIFISAYLLSPNFSDRVDTGYENISNYSEKKGTSVGYRMTFTLHSLEIIKNNPIFGVGTGDFPEEYKKINMIRTPIMNNPTNPHNMYILVTTQLGLVGLISFLSIFYFQFKFAFQSKNIFVKNTGFALPAMFLVVMLSDSYLLGHFTTLMFIFFSAILYKDFENA